MRDALWLLGRVFEPVIARSVPLRSASYAVTVLVGPCEAQRSMGSDAAIQLSFCSQMDRRASFLAMTGGFEDAP
jgi:hypothetical protein